MAKGRGEGVGEGVREIERKGKGTVGVGGCKGVKPSASSMR